MANTIPKNYYNVSESVPSWAEVAGMSFTFTADRSQGTIVWDIPEDSSGVPHGTNLQTFAREALGWSEYNSAAGLTRSIKRHLPARHPMIPWLFASQISSVVPIGPQDSRAELTDNFKQRPTNVIGETEPITVRSETYKLWRATVVYEAPPFHIKPDADTPKEWMRNTLWGRVPSIEFVQMDRGFLQFPADAGKMANKVITKSGGLALRKVKQKITIDWLQVPDIGLFGLLGQSRGGQAISQDECLGKVNYKPWPKLGNDFVGYPRGTLLLEGWTCTPHTMINSYSFNDDMPVFGDPVLRSWDVHFDLSYFDPPPGGKDTEGNLIRGHNLVPSPADGLWYRGLLSSGTKERTVAKPKYHPDDQRGWKYQQYDFDNLFLLNIF